MEKINYTVGEEYNYGTIEISKREKTLIQLGRLEILLASDKRDVLPDDPVLRGIALRRIETLEFAIKGLISDLNN